MTVIKTEAIGFDLDLTYSVAQSENVTDLRAAAERFAKAYDFSYWIYALAGPDKVLTNYPDELVTTYTENRWHQGCDPLLDAIHRHRRALSWDLRSMPTAHSADTPQRRLMECRWDVGARAGVSAPSYDRRGNAFEYAIVSFSRDRPLCDLAKHHHEPRVQLFATYFLSMAQQVFASTYPQVGQAPPSLTHRERDCLTWVAVGKSSWEIGQVLGISEATVNFHLGNAATKLDVRGRVRAVAQAIRLGLISPI